MLYSLHAGTDSVFYPRFDNIYHLHQIYYANTNAWFNTDFIDDNEITSNNTVTSVCEYEAIKDLLHEDNSGKSIINTTSSSISIPTVLPVSVDDLGEFVLKCHKNENDIFIDQFQVMSYRQTVALH